MLGRLRPWSLFRAVKSEIEWSNWWHLQWWVDGFEVHTWLLRMFWGCRGSWWHSGSPNARIWIRLGVSFRVTRGQMPENMLSSTSWPSSSECRPLLGGDGSCLEGESFLPFGFLPSPGVRAGWGGSTPLWKRSLGAPWGTFGVWISCVFEKIYPFWTCLWKQLGRSQDRFWFLILYSVYSEK